MKKLTEMAVDDGRNSSKSVRVTFAPFISHLKKNAEFIAIGVLVLVVTAVILSQNVKTADGEASGTIHGSYRVSTVTK